LAASSTPKPPVSITSAAQSGEANSGPGRETTVLTRSRVTPGLGSTIETRRWASMFNRLDLPTLGRPTMAIRGRGIVWYCRAACHFFERGERSKPAAAIRNRWLSKYRLDLALGGCGMLDRSLGV
jgi:hypothetical protein